MLYSNPSSVALQIPEYSCALTLPFAGGTETRLFGGQMESVNALPLNGGTTMITTPAQALAAGLYHIASIYTDTTGNFTSVVYVKRNKNGTYSTQYNYE